jgi:hypothetical protein
MKNPATSPDYELNDFTKELLTRIYESDMKCAWVELRNGMIPAVTIEQTGQHSFFVAKGSLYLDKSWKLNGKASNPLDVDLDMVRLSDA